LAAFRDAKEGAVRSHIARAARRRTPGLTSTPSKAAGPRMGGLIAASHENPPGGTRAAGALAARPQARENRMPDPIIVVANRLPLTLRRTGGRWTADASSGGLVAALGPVVRRAGGLWVGWPGDPPDEDLEGRAALLEAWERDRGLAAVELPEKIGHAFYDGFANDTLWPLLHGFPSRVVFDPATFLAYRDANRRFADAVLERARPDDLIWVHDYQLMLVPALLRAARPRLRIAYFLHVPFPSPEQFRILPQRDELLVGLLGADVIGFQTHEHMGAFRRTVQQVLGIESRIDAIEVGGRSIALQARPVGIVAAEWDRLVDGRRGVGRRVAELRRQHAGRKLVLAVDRLDDTKGIPERLRTFRHLLTVRPEWRRAVTLLQVAVPSRERVPRYAALRREVNELVGEINGAYGTADWSPVVYLRRSVSRPELAAMYAAADVGWVGSLRDGMNLVAKEFVACQREQPGVLLLSEFAGAASEMGEAVRINPYDTPGTAAALARALEMPDAERAERHAALAARVRRNDAVSWALRSVTDLERATADRALPSSSAGQPPVAALLRAFAASRERLCALDYDGTLVPLAPRPTDAAPTAAVLEIIERLSRRAGTHVAIVSGRSRADLDRWFGSIPSLWLAAEHGALVREPDVGEWHALRHGAASDWMPDVRSVLDHYLARVPGSMVEAKEHALAWHFRLVEPEFGEWIANEVAATLSERLAGTELVVLRGSKVIEVRYAWANKGELIGYLQSRLGDPGFKLAAGDDATDEDMFARMSPEAFTVHVGGGATAARYRVAEPSAVLALLAALAGTRHAGSSPEGVPPTSEPNQRRKAAPVMEAAG
jgi:trehalose 6-phosphate synthase/phosphatase